jgi:hypothetical protein
MYVCVINQEGEVLRRRNLPYQHWVMEGFLPAR